MPRANPIMVLAAGLGLAAGYLSAPAAAAERYPVW